ncbi:MAG TPA: ATP-binding protein, partial [Chloroflexota bacterium]|nr:ATP-binding protein [Chloroflexota bacterium]
MSEAETPRLDRVTAGEALYRVIRTLTERRPIDDILAEILGQTRAMLDAAETYILLKVGDQLTVRAADGLVSGPAARGRLNLGEGIEGLAAATGEAITAPSLKSDPRHVDPFARLRPVGSMVAVPLVLRGHLLGVLASTRRPAGRFATVELWWLEVFGGLIASLIASDQAYRAQERRARQAEALLALSSGDDLPAVSNQTVAEIARALGYDRSGILLLEASRTVYEHTVFTGAEVDHTLPARVTLAEVEPLRALLPGDRSLTCRDVAADPNLSGLKLLREIHCFIAAPIRVGTELRGIVYVGSAAIGSLDGDEAFLELVATRIGLLLERAELRERQREIELQQIQMEARQEFLGTVSHELKTPVAVMQAYTEVLLRRAERGGRGSEIDILRRMSDQAERMLGMIEQLLDLRRLAAGLLALEVSHFDLSETVRRLAHEIELASGSHRIVVDLPGRVLVRADRRRIEEVMTNLLDNAVKYSPRDSTIRVTLTREHPDTPREAALLEVRDEGPGVAEGERERIFERFYQAPGRLHKGHTGLGLGLFISRELVRRHGG